MPRQAQGRGGSVSEGVRALRQALDRLGLSQIPRGAWTALREPLGADGEPPHGRWAEAIQGAGAGELREAARALQELRPGRDSEALWDWLALPADADEIDKPEEAALLRVQALLVALWHALRTAPDLMAGAGQLYLALLSVDGARRHWSSLFQPSLLRLALRPLRALRAAAGPTAAAVEAGFTQEAGEEGPWCDAPYPEALQLLASLAPLFRQAGRGAVSGSPEAASMALDELTALVLHAGDEEVAGGACEALDAVIGGSEDVRGVAAASLRALLPALLMTQAGLAAATSSVPKPLQRSRAVALAFACDLVRRHPVLLESRPADPAALQAAARKVAAEATEDAAKRTQKAPESDPPTDEPVLSLLQRLCVLAPDRAEWRSAAAQGVRDLLGAALASSTDLGKKAKADFDELAAKLRAFLARLLRCERAASRMVAVEVVTLLAESGRELAAIDENRELLEELIERCADAVPTVRAKALTGVAAASRGLPGCPAGRRLLLDLVQGDPNANLAVLFRAAAADDKTMVRRAALSFFDAVMPLLRREDAIGLSEAAALEYWDVTWLSALAADASVAVRRAAIGSISGLVRCCPGQQAACRLWAREVLPLLRDAEATAAERALEEVRTVVLAPLERAGARQDRNRPLELPAVLDVMDAEAVGYLQQALGLVARQPGGLPVSLTASLAALAERTALEWPPAQWPLAIWGLLETAAATAPPRSVLPPHLALQAWARLGREALREPPAGRRRLPEKGPADAASRRREDFCRVQLVAAAILRVMAQTVVRAPEVMAQTVAQELLAQVSSFSAPARQTREMLRVVAKVNAKSWGKALLEPIMAALERLQAGSSDATTPCRALYTLGELVLLDDLPVSKGLVQLLQSIAINKLERGGQHVELPPAVRAHGVAAFGKLLLRREALAKQSIELLILHLGVEQPFAVRTNVLVVLGDLCKQYASLVERFVPSMTDLLRDPSELLRKHAAMTLSSLVSEDFIKLRGSIVLRFLFVLSDPSAEICHLMECVFDRILLTRQPNLFALNAMDAICALNGWSELAGREAAVGNEAFSLAEAPERRADIYGFMLARMTTEQKFAACSRIATTVLSAFAAGEGALRLPKREKSPAGQVLVDCLALLGCREMRLHAHAAAAASRAAAEDGGDGEATQSIAEDLGLLAGLFRRLVGDEILPVLIQLKNQMESQRSPLLGRLRTSVREMLRETREDMPRLLAGDARFAEEVEYDLRENGGPRRLSLEELMAPATSEPPAFAAASPGPRSPDPREYAEPGRETPGERRPLSSMSPNLLDAVEAMRARTSSVAKRPRLSEMSDSTGPRLETPDVGRQTPDSVGSGQSSGTDARWLGRELLVDIGVSRPSPGSDSLLGTLAGKAAAAQGGSGGLLQAMALARKRRASELGA